MGAVLTAGGKTAKSVTDQRTQVELFDAWDRAIVDMLKVAAASATAKQRVDKMQLWLANDENHWHPKYQERYDQYWLEKMDANAVSARLFDMSIRINELQIRMAPDWIRGLSALVGCDLYPHVSQQFAIWAQRTGSDDLFEVVNAWQAAEYLEDKRMEEGMRHEPERTAYERTPEEAA